MTKTKWLRGGLLTALVLLGASALRASDPVGVYCLIDRVVFEPNDSAPTAVQIWGAFSLAVPRSRDGAQTKPAGSFGALSTGDVYGAVQKGYVYFTCPPARLTACRNEWNDLKSLAGKREIAGFGARYGTPVTVRPSTAGPTAPDVFEASNIGVVKIGQFSADPDLVAALKAAQPVK